MTGLKNVWGVGDVGNLESKQLMRAEGQAFLLAENLDVVLSGAKSDVKELMLTLKPQIVITLGKEQGTGQFSCLRVPGFAVSALKGKNFFAAKGRGLVAGKNIANRSI